MTASNEGSPIDDGRWDVLVEIEEYEWIPTCRMNLPDHRSDGTGDIVDALCELFEALVEFGSACVIISTPDRPCRFVQCIATPVGFRLEATSNVFLWDTDDKLTDAEESLLVGLGWNAPDVPSDPANRPNDWREDNDGAVNWWREIGGLNSAHATASSLLTTLVLVQAGRAETPLKVEIFPSDRQFWCWNDGSLEPDDL
jgi:hypothetical protein